jgi:spermidine synthase
MKEKTSLKFLSIALMLSGAAGLVNQVVWQRALKVFLGGSETISSMIVVLVFLGGLGLGSSLVARSSGGILFPSKLLAGVEIALGAANLMVAWLLKSDLAESVYQFQRAALAFGIPLRVLYASGAIAILGIPCLLMGTTLPLAAQTMQAELGYSKNRLVNRLYFLNTLGAVSGAVTGVSVLMPRFGQTLTLLTAAGLNLVAGLSVALLNALGNRARDWASAKESACRALPALNEAYGGFHILGFGFGFCSLWYEMFLYRAVGLRHEPLPLVFSAVVTGFLLFWSVGAWISSKKVFSDRLKSVLILCSILMLGALIYFVEDVSSSPLFSASDALLFALRKVPYFLPCLLFGMLFGLALAKSIAIWGRDVGWFSAWNTLGACMGVLTALLVGYEMDLMWMIVVGVLLLLALGGVIDRIKKIQLAVGPSCSSAQTITRFANLPSLIFLLLAASTAIFGFSATPRPNDFGTTSFFGRDGVIVVDKHGNLAWDGLWHSRLVQNNNHVGTYNWALAVDPILAHPTGDISEALVIGMGSGVTAVTLSKLESVKRVDVYDINQTLRRVLARFPAGTMHVAQNPKIRIVWQDARSGLALNDRKYDLITQQPLYLKQAGSSILLSKEYFSLVSKRLKENGVLCVYANGTSEQAFVVRRTASQIFPHVLALHNGYSLILSFTPLSLSDSRLSAAFSQTGELWEEVRWFTERIGRQKWREYIKNVDSSLADSGVLIKDDFPIVEYPRQLKALLREAGYSGGYPQPEFHWMGQ